MRLRRQQVEIRSTDYWFKIVDFLQQNWALIDQDLDDAACTVYFFGDTSGVFDRLRFRSVEEAEDALDRNGFAQYSLDTNVQTFLAEPAPPFFESEHPNGLIYSSGRFWK